MIPSTVSPRSHSPPIHPVDHCAMKWSAFGETRIVRTVSVGVPVGSVLALAAVVIASSCRVLGVGDTGTASQGYHELIYQSSKKRRHKRKIVDRKHSPEIFVLEI